VGPGSDATDSVRQPGSKETQQEGNPRRADLNSGQNIVKLAPGERSDGVVQFSRPGFKQSKETLLLQLATADAVDHPVMIPLPFVAPGF
jgi:hypothetical protein